jgi:hypothetical protein
VAAGQLRAATLEQHQMIDSAAAGAGVVESVI